MHYSATSDLDQRPIRTETFSKLLPFAGVYNIRVIAFNRRNYVESSSLSDDEIGSLCGPGASDATRTTCLRERGLEVAILLTWMIENLALPRTKLENETENEAGAKEGGTAKGGRRAPVYACAQAEGRR